MNFKTFSEKFAILADAKADYEALENRCKSLEAQLADLKQTIDKSGYKVEQAAEGVFELVKDETPVPDGSAFNPYHYEESMTVEEGKWYRTDEYIWQCIKSGTPISIMDKEYFEVIE